MADPTQNPTPPATAPTAQPAASATDAEFAAIIEQHHGDLSVSAAKRLARLWVADNRPGNLDEWLVPNLALVRASSSGGALRYSGGAGAQPIAPPATPAPPGRSDTGPPGTSYTSGDVMHKKPGDFKPGEFASLPQDVQMKYARQLMGQAGNVNPRRRVGSKP